MGTHLCNWLTEVGIPFISIDKRPPLEVDHLAHWHRCDILDYEALKLVFLEFAPTHVVHLAARASMEGNSLDEFRDNTVGTKNILQLIGLTPSVQRFINTSTQHVFKPNGRPPEDDYEYDPLGLYGRSKVIAEQLTRNAKLPCCWTIIRPTAIWGPLHPHLPNGLWSIMRRGLYLHPRDDDVIRCYGYVKNSAWQILKILEAPASLVNRKVLYLGDGLMKQVEWVDAFSRALTGRPVRLVPRGLLRVLVAIGDSARRFGIQFPMYSERYRNLTTSNPVPISPTLKAFGPPPQPFEEGVAQTVQWLRAHQNQGAPSSIDVQSPEAV